MPQGAFFEQKRASPASLAIVIALHGAALTALLLAKGPVVEWVKPRPTVIYDVPQPPPPAEIEPKQQPEPRPEPPQHRSTIDFVPPIVETPPRGPVVEYVPLPPPALDLTPPGNVIIPEPPKADPPAPVRREAEIDPRYAQDLQPPYPASEERAEREGSVRIRITIGADGRVMAAERLSATSDSFWRATERQALSRWRFRPATVDGRPVESRKEMTVHFRLSGR